MSAALKSLRLQRKGLAGMKNSVPENREGTRWILAFDASCSSCRKISRTVERACSGRLEMMPLHSADVKQWRAASLGPQAPWAPTLIELRGPEVRAWTGPAMGLRLVRLLGARPTARVILGLGRLRAEAGANGGAETAQAREGAMGRAQFLRLAAGGTVAAAGLILSGKAPSFAASEATAARKWVARNKARLPDRYDDLVAYPMAHRRAIYAELSPKVRSELWTQQLRRYRLAHPRLSAAQARVVDQAARLAARETTFAHGLITGTESHQQPLRTLSADALRAFGPTQTYALIGVLGDSGQRIRPDYGECGCNINANYACWGNGNCLAFACSPVGGCGPFWQWECDGLCGS